MAPEDQKQLFAPFRRVRHLETEGTTGRGLGLYIIRELAELMGGEVRMESERGTASTVFYSLPTQRGGTDG